MVDEVTELKCAIFYVLLLNVVPRAVVSEVKPFIHVNCLP